nr:sugar ABC transporter substrate-binding protein [Microbacterium pseudoresistens]
MLAGCSSSRSNDQSDVAADGCDNDVYAQAGIDWQQYSGETITLSAQEHPWWNTVEPLIPCFEELTGITVDASVLGEDQYVSKIAVELSSGSSTPDVFMVNQFGQAAGSGWLEPLNEYLDDGAVTDADWYDFEDFFEGASDYGREDDKQLALPITAEAQMLFIRDDLVPDAPTTFDELVAAAEAANKDGVAGFGSRAVAAANQTPWPFGGFAFSSGGEYLDAAGTPQFASEANVQALTLYSELLTQYGPAGVSGWGFQENQQAMQQGTLAIWTDSSTFLGSLKDPEASQYAEEINAYPFPAGPSGVSSPNAWFWTIGMNSKSEHKDASWLFMQWATSAPVSEAGAENGASPARRAAWDSDGVSAMIGEDNAQRTKEALDSVDSTPLANAWKRDAWSQMSDPLARAINAAVTGGDPESELRSAQASAEKVAP